MEVSCDDTKADDEITVDGTLGDRSVCARQRCAVSLRQQLEQAVSNQYEHRLQNRYHARIPRVALLLRRQPTLKMYWPVAYALFVAAAANLVNWLLGNWLLPLFSAEITVAQDLAIDKVAQSLPVVATIIVLTLLAGNDLGSIFLQRGRVKAWLTFGLISFTICAILFAIIAYLQADDVGTTGLMAGGVPLATIVTALPSILIFVFANAIMEELWFRGVFLNKLTPLVGPFATVMATSLIFGVAHIGATYISPVEMFIFPLMVFGVGVLNAVVMLKTRSIWGSVLFHAGYDLLIIIPVILAG